MTEKAGAPVSGTEGYAGSADALAEQYESVSFEQLHHDILPLIPPAPSRILDIGAGIGRDAAALAALGHAVVAVEPTAELREHGERLHQDKAITWIDDSLPELARLRELGGRFDLVLLTAVWMHLDAGQREHAMASLSTLVDSGGLIALTLRHGPVPQGRRMFDVSADETAALALRYVLAERLRSARGDMFARPGVRWSVLVLGKA